MPTYYEIMSTDLSKLSTAADRWDETAGKFKTLGEKYERSVHGISLGTSWLGVSAQAANDRFSVTLKEFRGAQQEAKAVASVLRDAHTQLLSLQSKLKALRGDAIKAGMRVSEQGVVAFDTERLTQGERLAYVHDPSYQESGRAAATAWFDRINQAVQAVSDTDDGVRLALAAAVRDSDYMDGTLNGFNRKPVDSPYPSLGEMGKVANMPKDRAKIPEWWSSLDPTTRWLLLQERGDEMRAAGVMDPLYRWESPDEGSGGFNMEKSTPRDIMLHAQALAIATGGDVIGEVGASRNMLHYLGATGETLNLDVNQMLKDDSDFRSGIEETHLASGQDAWRQKALDEFHRAGGDKAVVVPVESKVQHRTLQSEEWFHAVGSHAQNISGMVTVTPGSDGGAPRVSLDYQVNVWDRYNWDAGKATEFTGGVTISDSDMGRLHQVGSAREFDMRGSSSAHSYDLNSPAIPSIEPGKGDQSGREGTRTDVSRGEEKNR